MKSVRGLQPDVDSGSLDLYLDSDLDRDGSHEVPNGFMWMVVMG